MICGKLHSIIGLFQIFSDRRPTMRREKNVHPHLLYDRASLL
jgi:hypothetical protein